MQRRTFIKAGAAGAAALAAASCRMPVPRGPLDSAQGYAALLYNSLNEASRLKACVPYDHPLRQFHNRGVHTGGASVSGRFFTGEQLAWLNRLFFAGLSEKGREITPNQYFLRWRGAGSLKFLIAGDPNTSRWQAMFSGPHLNLRLGGKNVEGVAFGGPQVYGDQRGNNKQGLPGNVYRYQFLKGCELFETLDPRQRQLALQAKAPVQTLIELQGSRSDFPGVPVKALSPASKQKATELIDEILHVYPARDVAYAWQCIQSNGGVDALSLSYFRDGEVDGSGAFQIFRLEGPAAVFYFRGYPHVHAFVNIGMDGDKPLSVGEALCENAAPLEGASVKGLFERAMIDFCQTDFAYYDRDTVAGRLRSGVIRTGDVYNLESWIHSVSAVSVKGSRLSGKMGAELARRGVRLEPEKTYSIATTNDLAEESMTATFGKGRADDLGIKLRDVVIAYLKKTNG